MLPMCFSCRDASNSIPMGNLVRSIPKKSGQCEFSFKDQYVYLLIDAPRRAKHKSENCGIRIWRKNSGSGEGWSNLAIAISYGFIYMRFYFPTH